MMNQVFISYSRVNENFARHLAADLDRDDLDVWIDVEDIPPGTNWSNAINEGLNSADAMILIMSPASMASKNVEDEWQYFHSQKMPLIPVLIEPCDNIHYQLARLQYINFIRPEYEAAYDELLGQLRIAGLDAKRLSDRLAEYEAERERKIEEKERLRRAIAQLEQEQAEIDRLQRQYDALQAAEAEEDIIEEKIQKVQAEEAEYKKVVEQEKKRATADESQQIAVYEKTTPIPVTVHDTPVQAGPSPVDVTKQIEASRSRGLSLPLQGALITGVVIALILVGIVVANGIFSGDDNANDNNGSFADTGDEILVITDHIALNQSLDEFPVDLEWRQDGDILALATSDDRVPFYSEDFLDPWQQTDSLEAEIARVAWYDETLAMVSELSDDVKINVWDIYLEQFLIDSISVGTCENSVAIDYKDGVVMVGCDSEVVVHSISESEDGSFDHQEEISYTLESDVVQVMIFKPNSFHFGAVDDNGRFYFWDTHEAKIDGDSLLSSDDVRDVSTWHPEEEVLIVSGPTSGKLWFVDVDEHTIEPFEEFVPSVESQITAINYAPVYELGVEVFAIGYEDGQVELRFLYEDEGVRIFRPPTPVPVTDIDINTYGEMAVSYGDDEMQGFIIWDIYAESPEEDDEDDNEEVEEMDDSFDPRQEVQDNMD